MPLTHIDSADFMKLLGVAVKKFSPYNVNFPVRWANNPKYSQKLLMHICVFLCSYIVMCISVFVYLNICIFPRVLRHECTHPECPLLNLYLLPRSAYFSSSSARIFQPKIPPANEWELQPKCKSAQIHKRKYKNTQMQIYKYTNANTFFSRQMNENCHQSTKVHYSGALQPFWGIELQTAPFCYSLWRKITKKSIFVLVNNIT